MSRLSLFLSKARRNACLLASSLALLGGSVCAVMGNAQAVLADNSVSNAFVTQLLDGNYTLSFVSGTNFSVKRTFSFYNEYGFGVDKSSYAFDLGDSGFDIYAEHTLTNVGFQLYWNGSINVSTIDGCSPLFRAYGDDSDIAGTYNLAVGSMSAVQSIYPAPNYLVSYDLFPEHRWDFVIYVVDAVEVILSESQLFALKSVTDIVVRDTEVNPPGQTYTYNFVSRSTLKSLFGENSYRISDSYGSGDWADIGEWFEFIVPYQAVYQENNDTTYSLVSIKYASIHIDSEVVLDDVDSLSPLGTFLPFIIEVSNYEESIYTFFADLHIRLRYGSAYYMSDGNTYGLIDYGDGMCSFMSQDFGTFFHNFDPRNSHVYWENAFDYVDERYSHYIVSEIEAYADGWYSGRTDLLNNSIGVTSSYAAGYDDGYAAGKAYGYSQGANDKSSTVFSLFGAVVSVPINILNGLSPLAIWDTPLISIIVTLLFVGLFLFMIKRIIFR